MADIKVSLEDRAEGPLLKVSVPRDVLEHVLDQGLRQEHLTEAVDVRAAIEGRSHPEPDIIRIWLDIEPADDDVPSINAAD